MRYPKYSREQNLVCKLKDTDIAYIKHRHKHGDSIKRLAEVFDVRPATIRYWVDEKFRVEILRQRTLYRKYVHPRHKKELEAKYQKRKNLLHPQIKIYYAQKNKDYDKRHPGRYMEYYNTHKEYMNRKRHEWNLKNPGKKKESDKRYYLKNKELINKKRWERTNIKKVWSIRINDIRDKAREKYRRTGWCKKTESLSKSWNIWHYQLIGHPSNTNTERVSYDWHSRFKYMLTRWSYSFRMRGWTNKIDYIRKEWGDTSKQIKGGLLKMEREILNEKVGAPGIRSLLEKQSYRCALTGRELTPENCSLDHILPLSRGGDHAMSNAQLVISDVNKAKGNLTDEEFINLCNDVVAYRDNK